MRTMIGVSGVSRESLKRQWERFLAEHCDGLRTDYPRREDHELIRELMERLVAEGLVEMDGAIYRLPRITPAIRAAASEMGA